MHQIWFWPGLPRLNSGADNAPTDCLMTPEEMPSNFCCLYFYLNIGGFWDGPGKHFDSAGEVREFFICRSARSLIWNWSGWIEVAGYWALSNVCLRRAWRRNVRVLDLWWRGCKLVIQCCVSAMIFKIFRKVCHVFFTIFCRDFLLSLIFFIRWL